MFWIFVFFIGGGWLIGKIIGLIAFPKKDDYTLDNYKEPNITIKNYTTNHITNNNLNVTSDELKKLKKS